MAQAISERKLEANRRNGRRSKGPITAEGTRRSSKNALKHGFLSEQVVLSTEYYEETESDYSKLLCQLNEDLKPIGKQEELLVETIAVSYWRRRRVLRAEAAEIELAKQKLRDQGAYSQTDEDWRSFLEYLESMKKRFVEIGCLSEPELQRLEDALPSEKDVIGTCRSYNNLIVSALKNPDQQCCVDVDTHRKGILEALDLLSSATTTFVEYIDRQAQRNLEVKMAAEDLPNNFALDRILRYEAAIDRQLYRAIAMLDHLQSRRKGYSAAQLTP